MYAYVLQELIKTFYLYIIVSVTFTYSISHECGYVSVKLMFEYVFECQEDSVNVFTTVLKRSNTIHERIVANKKYG